MTLRKKILIIILLFLIIGYSSLYFFVSMAGKDILAAKMKIALGRDVKVGRVNLVFPLSIMVRDFEIPGLVKISELFAGGGALDIFRRNFILSELRLNRVVVNIEKLKKEVPVQPEAAAPAAESAASAPAPQQPAVKSAPSALPGPAQAVLPDPSAESPKIIVPRVELPRVTLKHFRVKDSTINFTDRSVKVEGIKVTIEHLNMHVENLVLPIDESNIVSFDVSGRMPWQQGEGHSTQGEISASGWVNLYKRDMQAKLVVKDIDAISLHPYYAQWVDLEKARIQKAKLRFNSDITGNSGDVKAECHLELTDIVFRPKEDNEKEEKAHRIATVVLGLFQEFGGKVAVDFTFKTRMDKPDFNLDSIRTAVEDKLTKAMSARSGNESAVESAVTFPVKLLEGGVRSGAELSRALIEGVFTIGKGIRNGVEDLVSNKKTPEASNQKQPKSAPQSAETK